MTLDSSHSKHSHGEEIIPELSAEQRERVQKALTVVLSSQPMRSTLQCQTLLQYIAEHTLSGELALLRERVIGKEVFGRRPDYEPGEDPIVRIRAADLRKRLALYYQSLSVLPDVRIDVPSGSYKAAFIWKANEAVAETVASSALVEDNSVLPALESEQPGELQVHPAELPANKQIVLPSRVVADPTAPNRIRSIGTWVALAAMLVACAILGSNLYRSRSDRVLRTFWAPLLDSSKPVLISIGSNAVYRVADSTADEYSRKNHVENSGLEVFPKFDAAQTLGSTGLYPAADSFVALGDVASVSEVVATLAHFGKTFQERFPNDVSFAEVRSNPTVLIGGFNNPMARELTRNFRFVLASRNRIEDRNQPGKAWVLNASTDSHDTEDYAIVTRVLRREEDEPLVSVAGMGQYGTLAATDFICRPENLQRLTGSLGKDWLRQNFQIVLHIKIIDFKPVSTSVVATHTW